mgnify:CR=1 FL=1
MKIGCKIFAELVSMLLFTFVLSLGHVVVANVYGMPCLSWSFVFSYCLGCVSVHCATGLRKVPYGVAFTILICVVTLVATEIVLHKTDEKGCRDWVVKLIKDVRGLRK